MYSEKKHEQLYEMLVKLLLRYDGLISLSIIYSRTGLYCHERDGIFYVVINECFSNR